MEIKNPEWVVIHDFLYGWGYRKELSHEVLEDCSEAPIPYKVVKGDSKVLYASDVNRLMKRDLFNYPVEDLDAIFEELQPLLDKEIKEMKPFSLPDKIKIPLIKKSFPKKISEIFKNSRTFLD